MFITEKQLALYKYQPQNKYFKKPMSEIVQSELFEYMNSVKGIHNPIDLLNHFLNRRIDNKTWIFYFSDYSQLAIKKEVDSEQDKVEYYFSLLHEFPYPFSE